MAIIDLTKENFQADFSHLCFKMIQKVGCG